VFSSVVKSDSIAANFVYFYVIFTLFSFCINGFMVQQ